MTTNTKVKKVTKKVTKKVATKNVETNRVSLTMGQAITLANFYTKMGKKVPAFLAKKLV